MAQRGTAEPGVEPEQRPEHRPEQSRRPSHSPIGTLQRLARAPSVSVIGATLVLLFAIGALRPTYLQPNQLLDTLQASTYVGLIAAGMAYLVSMREIDLSVGSMFGLCLISVAMLVQAGFNSWLAAAAGIVLGGVLGGVNATIVAVMRIPTIVATLATLSVFRGLAIGLTDGTQVVNLPIGDSFFSVVGGKVLGIPFSILVLLVITLVVGVTLHHTPFGHRVLAIGSNPEAARFSGISVTRVRTQVLILVGLLVGVAAVLGLAFFTSGDPNIGGGFELQAIAAAVIGGTPLRGGSATVFGAAVGAILLNIVATGLTYFSVPANWSAFATGLVILLAVGVDSLVRRRRAAHRSTRTATS
ncbi:ABC transporter permease [Streptomyces phyllanthi]|uniref:Autoinducer 2 import system permease protein LsrC n=2 Tax=Streptomyces phyllanthi TaxID=1803180 RepID=A0A5N8VY22_9ACTN|nr:ABC transporter permease [Streptomyces phyllanthi]